LPPLPPVDEASLAEPDSLEALPPRATPPLASPEVAGPAVESPPLEDEAIGALTAGQIGPVLTGAVTEMRPPPPPPPPPAGVVPLQSGLVLDVGDPPAPLVEVAPPLVPPSEVAAPAVLAPVLELELLVAVPPLPPFPPVFTEVSSAQAATHPCCLLRRGRTVLARTGGSPFVTLVES